MIMILCDQGKLFHPDACAATLTAAASFHMSTATTREPGHPDPPRTVLMGSKVTGARNNTVLYPGLDQPVSTAPSGCRSWNRLYQMGRKLTACWLPTRWSAWRTSRGMVLARTTRTDHSSCRSACISLICHRLPPRNILICTRQTSAWHREYLRPLIACRLPRIAKIFGHFSIQNHRSSGANLHSFYIFNRKFREIRH